MTKSFATTLYKLYQEAYVIGQLSEAQQKKFHLIQRYYTKVSPRLKHESEDMLTLGEKLYQNFMKELINVGLKDY